MYPQQNAPFVDQESICEVFMIEVILASSSPRRRIWISKMLESSGVDLSFFDLRGSEPEPGHGSEVRKQVEKSCTYKAIEASKSIPGEEGDNRIILVSDTLVEDPDDNLCALGKPIDKMAAAATLIRLSGRRHLVWSSTAILEIGKGALELKEGWRASIFTDSSIVEFEEISHEMLDEMISTKSWIGKAGGYDLGGIAGSVAKVVRGKEVTVLGFSCNSMDVLTNRLS